MDKTNKKRNYRLMYVCLILVILTLFTYWQVRNFDFVNYDDDKYITNNRHVNTGLKIENIEWASQSTQASNWHPITWVSLMVDAELFGLKAGYFHLANLFLHILNSLLLLLVLYKMTGALWRSAAVAVLFAIHPLHVESVAWVAERKDVLSTFFMMLSLWAYIHYVGKPGFKRYALVFILFALGLMSKPMVVTFPFVLLLLDYWPLQRFSLYNANELPSNSGRKVIAGLIYEKIPLFLLAGISVILTIIAQGAEITIMQKIPLELRIENALVAYCGYIVKMIWPSSLAVLYPYPEFISLWQVLGAVILLMFISGLAIYTVNRFPYFVVGWLWYLGTLVPVIGLVQVGVQSMADRYTYIPFIGLFVVLVWVVSDITARLPYRKYVLTVVFTIIVSLLVLVTWSQLGYWKNSYVLFNRALAVTEKNYVMHCNLAVLLAGEGKVQDATFHYNEALRIKPDDADTNFNLGNLLAGQGKLEEAIVRYHAALVSKPKFAMAYNNLGIAYVQTGNGEKAIEQFSEAVKIDPNYLNAQENLKTALSRQEKLKESTSIKKTEKTESVNTFQGHMEAGNSLLGKGDLDGAINHFKAALKLNPDNLNAHVSIGLALGYKHNFEEAITHFRKAIKINSKIPEIYNSLAVALSYTGRVDEAIIQLKKAIEINPQFAKAHNSLGVMLAKKGKIDEGIAHLREAVKIDPGYLEAKKNLELVSSMKRSN